MTERPVRHVTALGPQAAAPSDRPARQRITDPKVAAQVRQFAIDAARLATDLHCENALVLDVRGLSDITDYILIASGTSDRQIMSVAEDIEQLAEGAGIGRLGHELESPSTWVVLDFVDVVAHLFEPTARAHYDLEMLWGDAEKVPWQRDD